MFDDCNLSGARLERTRLRGIRVHNGLLTGCRFSSADLTGADLRGSNDTDAGFTLAILLDVQTGPLPAGPERTETRPVAPGDARKLLDRHIGQVLGRSGDRQPVDLANMDLRDAGTLAGAALTALRAPGSVMAGMNLRGAQLQGARLAGADMSGCDLSGADLRGADLSGCDLRHANLRGARLTPLALGGERLLPVNLDNAVCRYADLRTARFDRPRLNNTDFRHARFDLAALQASGLSSAQADDVLTD